MWLVLFLYFISAAATCGPGTIKDTDGACTQCLPGYAQSEYDQSSCRTCMGGKFSPDKGYSDCSVCPMGFFSEDGTVNTRCIGCSPGKFQDRTNADYCLSCDTGFFSDAGSSSCTGCPTGRYSDEYGASTCFDCHRGRYADDSANIECTTCSIGQYTVVTGQRECKNCSSSPNCRYCSGFGGEPGNCTSCEKGKYSSAVMEFCEKCGWGHMPDNGAVTLENIHDAQPNANGYWTCSPCSYGFYFEPTNITCMACGLGTRTHNYSCIDCIPGQYRDKPINIIIPENETCAVCPTGFFGENPIQCTACPTGQYQANTNQTICDDCDSTLRSMPAASICSTNACLVGNGTATSTCLFCAAGQEVVSTTCTQCANNYIKPYTYGACLQCSAGLISNTGNTACDVCPTGKYEDNGTCVFCLIGTYMPTDSPTPPVLCQECEAGQYQDQTGQTNCKNCSTGKFIDESKQSVCKDCPKGWVTNSTASPICAMCDDGTGQPDSGQITCNDCTNQTHVSRNGICQPCLAGTEIYGTGTLRRCLDCQEGEFSTSGSVCTNCPEGYATEGISTSCTLCNTLGKISNVAGPGSSFCIACDSTVAMACQDCPSGNFFNGTQCLNCPAGWIAAKSGAISCSICNEGSWSDGKTCTVCSEGKYAISTSCKNCSTGKYGNVGICIDCDKGTYQPTVGQSSCIDCGPGKVTTTKGNSAEEGCTGCAPGKVVVNKICSICPPNTYKSETTCINCIAGKFNNILGSVSDVCEDCVVGKSSKTGESCKNCATGKYADQVGSTYCLECVASSVNGNTCAECVAGKYGTPASGCRQCPSGYRTISGQSACAPCNIGNAQPEKGSSTCLECTPGRYSNKLGTSECVECAIGKFLETPKGGQCYNCQIGRYSSQLGLAKCHRCPGGTYTTGTGATGVGDCLDCPSGYMEVKGSCEKCPERFYQPDRRSTECISCPSDKILSQRGSVKETDCFSKEGLVTYVFGMKGDSKEPQSYSKTCEIRPNLVMLCPGCSCDDDSRNGFWAGPKCDECRRGFATSLCTAKCPAYDGEHDSTMCSGNGFCWFGKFGTGLCYCGGKSKIDPSGENVVVDVQLCPKGKICPGYGLTKQLETTYKPLYYIIRYRQFSTFVLLLNRYTPKRGHMWFKRFAPSIAYENTCLSCVGAYSRNPKTTVGFWNKYDDYEDFPKELQTENGFHGENCQYECGLCLNGGRCLNVPHPYRYSYTIEDSFRGEKPIFLPTTTCICSSLVYDSENMCCPNGFQPYVHYGLRLNTNPYSRFNRVPFLSGIKNEIRDYWLDRDIWLDIVEYPKYKTPYLEPDSGKMFVANNNNIWSDVQNDYVEVDYRTSGPYNKHIFYGVPRDICRACPGLFGKGVKTTDGTIDTEYKAEEYWWDNAMGASARKCNGIGVCDFYARPTEAVVDFMGNAKKYPLYERGRLCKTNTIVAFTNRGTKEECIFFGETWGAAFVAFSEPYSGGKMKDMIHIDGKLAAYDSLSTVKLKMQDSVGYASFMNGTKLVWTIISSKTNMPIPDSDSPFTSYSDSVDTCGAFATCEKFITVPRFNIYKLQFGRGDDRPKEATFNRFDTCFTYTKDDNIQTLGLYVTQTYVNGEDPFLGGLCPKGHYCTEYNHIGYKEACPPGYYQPNQGQTRTISGNRCNIATRPMVGCQSNEGTVIITDYTDNICIRCPRNFYAEEGSAVCTECSFGSVKKISGTPVNIRGTAWTFEDPMLNFPISFTAGYNPWYYISNELGREDTDCAQVPPGIVHLPTINNYMEYDKPNFLAVIACPFGFSSRPGTFVFEGFSKLTRLVATSPDAVIDPPFIEFKRTFVDKNIGILYNCKAKNEANRELDPPGPTVTLLDFSQCEKLLIKEGITEMRIHTGGIKGCRINRMRPTVGIFSSGGAEIYKDCLKHLHMSDKRLPSQIEYLCREGDNNDGLAGEFARANCFRCPGNSITGPSSTACTTCFANQMKTFAKEAIQKVVEGATHNMYSSISPTNPNPTAYPAALTDAAAEDLEKIDFIIGHGQITLPSSEVKLTQYNSNLQNYDLTLDMKQQYWTVNYEFQPVPTIASATGQSEPIELKLSDCFLVCSHVDKKVPGITAVGLFKNKLQPFCACSTQAASADHSGVNNGYAWLRVDSGKPGIGYRYAFDGECGGNEIVIYTSTIINPGLTNFERTKACFNQCKDFEDINGFVIIPDTGECKCEYILSSGCTSNTRIPNMYIRYDLYPENQFAPWGFSALPLCAACQPGKYTGSGCIPCLAGYYTATAQDAQAITCKSCAVGLYTETLSSTGCKDCALGKFTDVIETENCPSCPKGFKQGLIGQMDCVGCPIGYFASSMGSYICTICTIGKYQDAVQGVSCKNCAAAPYGTGYYSDTEGAVSCKGCPIGYTHQSTTACQGCTAGKYQSAKASSVCISCVPGKYGTNEKRTNNCDGCPFGKYTEGIASTACQFCSGGRICSANKQGSSKCVAGAYLPAAEHALHCKGCPVATISSTGATRCRFCPKGQSTGGATGQASCTACPPKGWIGTSGTKGAGNQRLKGHTTFRLENPTAAANDGYHECPWGGPLVPGYEWACIGMKGISPSFLGGRRRFTTFITSKVSGYYVFLFNEIDDWVNYHIYRLRPHRVIAHRSWTVGYTVWQPIWISAGETIGFGYTCDNYSGAHNCQFYFSNYGFPHYFGSGNNLMFFQTDPGTGYCGAPEHTMARTTLRGTRELQETMGREGPSGDIQPYTTFTNPAYFNHQNTVK